MDGGFWHCTGARGDDFVWGHDSLPPASAAAVPPGVAKYTFKVCTILKKLPEASSQTRRGPQRMAAGCFSHACRESCQPSLQTSELRCFIAISFQWLSLKTLVSDAKGLPSDFKPTHYPLRSQGALGVKHSEVFSKKLGEFVAFPSPLPINYTTHFPFFMTKNIHKISESLKRT